MEQSPAPSLEQLKDSPQPAWLWDGARGRIVWANVTGVTLFGGETLFDLIDRPFDKRDRDIARIAELTSALGPGDRQSQTFEFAGATDAPSAVHCRCSLHLLPDGRNGLLVVADDVEPRRYAADSGLMTDILGAMPIAIAVSNDRGQIVYSNAAAVELMPRATRSDLSTLTGSASDGDAILERIVSAGTLGLVRTLATSYGEREVRLTVRLLEDDETSDSNILVMLEDVTDRRALERQLTSEATGNANTTVAEVHTAAGEVLSERPAEDAASTELQLTQLSEAISQHSGGDIVQQDAEDSLADVPEIVSRTLDNISDAIILHRDNRFYFANAAAVELLGCNDVASVGLLDDLMEALTRSLEGPGHLSVNKDTGEPVQLVASHDTFPWHDGPLVQTTLRLHSEPVTTETAHDKTEDPSARAASTPEPVIDRATEPLPAATLPGDPELRAILDTSTDGIVTLAADGTIVSFSAGAEALFGYRLADVAGRPLSDLLSDNSKKTLRDYLAALSDGGLASVFNDGREVTGVVSQGGEISLFMTIARMDGTSEAAFCAVLRDITQWKKTEAQLRQDKDAAERANTQKSEFLARISHELRTPLNAILGFSDVMRSERFGKVENEKYLGYANDIHRSGSHLLSLINDLLDLSKVEAGKLELNFTSVDLRAIIEDCFSIMQDEATSARVVLRKSLPADLPNVVADFRSIKQIVLNLLSNAIKFTDPGGQVIVSAKISKAGELVLKFKDTGIGMGPKELQNAMEPFTRVETPERGERSGTGLGLPLTKALTEANRAAFNISSERKKGTLIEITFPTTRVLAD